MRIGAIVKIMIMTAFVLPLTLFATVIVDGGFQSGDFDTQNPSGSLQWYKTTASTSYHVIVDDGSGNNGLQMGGGTAYRGITGYFAASGSPITLNASGDHTIRLSWDVTPLITPTATGYIDQRMVLANTSGNRMTTDGTAYHLATTGYAFGHTATSADSATIRYISDGANDQFRISSTADTGTSSGSGQTSLEMVADTTYSFVWDIKLLGDGNVEHSYTMSDGVTEVSYSYVDEDYKFSSFDTIAMGTGEEDLMLYGNLKLELVPEPATIGLLGLGSLVALVIRRMRK